MPKRNLDLDDSNRFLSYISNDETDDPTLAQKLAKADQEIYDERSARLVTPSKEIALE